MIELTRFNGSNLVVGDVVKTEFYLTSIDNFEITSTYGEMDGDEAETDTKINGGKKNLVTMTIDTTALTEGTYEAELTITTIDETYNFKEIIEVS